MDRKNSLDLRWAWTPGEKIWVAHKVCNLDQELCRLRVRDTACGGGEGAEFSPSLERAATVRTAFIP